MSGGCYALIGMHLANLIQNWKYMKFRVPILCMFVTMIGVDIGTYVAFGDDNVSHAAHVGGCICGVILGILLGKPPGKEDTPFYYFHVNDKFTQRLRRYIALTLGILMVLF